MTPGEVVTGLSYLAGAGVFLWAARRRRLATEGMAILAGVGFVSGIVGAKLSQTIASGFSLSTAANPGGRALLGGLAFGWLGVEVAKRVLGIRRSTGDLFALALPAGEAVGRIGCHLNGCCYGISCDAPYAVWSHGAFRFPSQLLSAAVAAATFAFLLWLSKTFSPLEGRGAMLREGDLFRVYLVLFGITRFGLEFVRWRESVVFGLSPMQWFCLDLIVIGGMALIRRKRRDLPQLRPGV